MYGGPAFVGAGLQADREARMVVEQGQRVAARPADGEMALEVHLPKIVGGGVLEADKRAMRGRMPAVQPAVAAQDRGDRARARHLRGAQIQQPPAQLAPAPGRMRVAQRQHMRLHRLGRTARRTVGAARAVMQPGPPLSPMARQPLVTRRRADTEAPAQPTQMAAFRPRQQHKLLTQIHGGHLLPRHGSLLPRENSCLNKPVHHVPEHPSAMSPVCTDGGGQGGGDSRYLRGAR